MQPVGTPDVLRNLPSLLLDRNSPLAIRTAALPSLAPWLWRFARQSLPGAARRNAMALAALLADAAPRWRSRPGDTTAARSCRSGLPLLVPDRSRAGRRRGGLPLSPVLRVAMERLTAPELAALEPDQRSTAAVPSFRHFRDRSGKMVGRLANAAAARGATFVAGRVTLLSRRPGGVRLGGPGVALTARHAIIAAGAHSRDLARQAGDRIPLETERGYHLEWDMDVPPLTRPVCPTDRGFYICPMAGRLRVAGTVELGGLDAPPSPHRIARLREGARSVFADLPDPDRDWMGFRPSIPDSLPVIGPSSLGADVLFAFGHGHIGLTLAPVTAEMIAAQILGNAPLPGAAAVRAQRF
ncbi:MAG: FAD-binding oxidoreductase [Rhodobacteraceae bacterium]|nr:FAD-binding oxidoreductase [Paracoccaceae bacterium]